MPTVLREGPYRFFFVSHDRGEPPHVHVKRDKMAAKFWLNPIVLAKSGGFDRTEINTIYKILTENEDHFLEEWDEFFNC